jgi:hypothetical protein
MFTNRSRGKMWTLRICSTKNDDQTAISTRIFFQLKLNSKVSWNKKWENESANISYKDKANRVLFILVFCMFGVSISFTPIIHTHTSESLNKFE